MQNLTCPTCTLPFSVAHNHKTIYCSTRCKEAAPRRRARPKRSWRGRDLTCAYCARAFTSVNSHPQRCCSYSCAFRLRSPAPSSPLEIADCAQCGRAFVKRHQRRQCCSSRCRMILHRGVNASPIRYGDCPECGGVFVRRADQLGGYCSRRCAKKTQKRADRARRKGVARDQYTLRQIAERDGWRCHLCGKRVPDHGYQARPSDPTIDHLIPMGAGGDDTLTNVALAHNLCNSRRGVRGEAQLRLIA